LVVALSLMLLLTLIAIGLLTLSRISLRASNQGMAMAETRSNPLLALMLALGDLRKHAGPDRAITATSEILATPTTSIAKPNTNRVWESWWDFNPNAAPGYASGRTSRFRRWLVSGVDIAAAGSRDFVTAGWTGKSIKVVGEGSLAFGRTDVGKVTAGLVPASEFCRIQGSFFWHVSDGSVKARVNHYRDPDLYMNLIERGYTCPETLAVEGRSNGGLLMGAFLTQHPELARAVVAHVGIYDMLRFELEPNGAFNVTEFGTIEDPAQFRAMHAYSPYHQVRDGTSYPAVLLLTGENDGRVSPANSRKMAARLQQANASTNPILVQLSTAAGHGMGTALAERIADHADVLAFLFNQLAMTQPKARDFERSV